ncbi:hypothetical protein BC834DRAFT_391265 [Gloeopeniophorella convolvens]|nr:hypothetical protein BC834DRAFT_391265 [Gloeopeniophorella convolvens]
MGSKTAATSIIREGEEEIYRDNHIPSTGLPCNSCHIREASGARVASVIEAATFWWVCNRAPTLVVQGTATARLSISRTPLWRKNRLEIRIALAPGDVKSIRAEGKYLHLKRWRDCVHRNVQRSAMGPLEMVEAQWSVRPRSFRYDNVNKSTEYFYIGDGT